MRQKGDQSMMEFGAHPLRYPDVLNPSFNASNHSCCCLTLTAGLGADTNDNSRPCCRSPSSMDWRKTQNVVSLFPAAEEDTQHNEMKRMKNGRQRLTQVL